MALKLEQLAVLLGGGRVSGRDGTAFLAERVFFHECRGGLQDDREAEKAAGLVLAGLGPDVLLQLSVVLSCVRVEPGLACVGLRVIADLSPALCRKTVAAIIARGNNDVLCHEAVIMAWRRGMNEELARLPRLVHAWRGWGRQYPIFVLGRSGMRAAVPEIVSALDDTSPAVRRHAVLALSRLGGAEIIGPLERLLDHEKDALVRAYAEAVLSKLKRSLPPSEQGAGFPEDNTVATSLFRGG